MQFNTQQLSAVAFAFVLVVSVVAPVVGGAGPTGGHAATEYADANGDVRQSSIADERPTEDRQTRSAAVDTAAERSGRAASVAPTLANASGTTEVVVRLSESPSAANASLPAAASDRARQMQSLKSHARQQQGSVVSFARRTDGVELASQFWLSNAVLLEVDLNEVDLGRLARVEGVERLHPNFQVSVPEPNESSDPASTGDDTGAAADDADPASTGDDAEVGTSQQDATYGLDQINATEVWDTYGTRGGGVKVAVLDTGVDPDHPDVDLYTDDPGNETYPGGWAEFDANGNQVEGSTPHDTDSHGTHTSGTVAGGDASGEYVGVAPNASLMHGMVLPSGSGSFAQIVAGMEWAVEQDADVVSMSLGAPDYYAQFIEPVRNARNAGTVVVAAAGNSGQSTSGSPGNVYDSFTVGASDADRAIASFSSGEVVETATAWGTAAPEDWPDSYVVPDVAAPGVAVKSAVPGGGYQSLSGTSMATPHVAGAFALAVSAADENVSVAELESAFLTTASKPETCDPSCDPRDGNDTRYGTGIVDARAATDLLAADSGVTGTITDADGDPVADASVELPNGFTVRTDESGEYTLHTGPGEHAVEVDKFGHESAAASVAVPDGEFVTRDFTLPAMLEVDVVDAQQAELGSAENVSVTLRAANVESYAVDLAGSYAPENATLYVNGDRQAFGDPVEFAEPVRDEFTVTVEVPDGTEGTVTLKHAFGGLGGDVELTTGPTNVVPELVDVGVVDAPGGSNGDAVATALRASLSNKFRVSLTSTTEALSLVDEYDVFVAQNLMSRTTGTPTNAYVNTTWVREFVAATQRSETGVVALDQYGYWSYGLSALSDATGNPASTADQFRYQQSPPVSYTVEQDHPILDGVAEAGDTVELYSVYTGDHSWFHGYDGEVIADVGYRETEPTGQGLAADELTGIVHASSLGRTALLGENGYYEYTDDADRILANSVEYAAADRPVSLESGQADHVSPGESTEVTVAADDLRQVEVSVDGEHSTLSADDLTLTIDGQRASFGQPVSYDEPVTAENLTIGVETDGDAVGSVSLDLAFVAGEDDETITGSTGPTAVYEPPLEVPQDVDSIQAAVDLAPAGAEIVVDDGTYTEQVDVTEGGKYNLTIRSADGADPVVEAPDGLDNSSTVRVNTDDVTVEGLSIDAGGTNDGVLVYEADGVTVRDVSVSDARNGIMVDFWSADSTVRNNVVTDADAGIFHYWKSDNAVVQNNTVTDVGMGIRMGYLMGGYVVEGNAVTDADTGLSANGQSGIFLNNTVTDVGTGAVANPSGNPQFTRNAIRNATTGVLFEPGLNSGVVTENEIDADTGILLEGTVPRRVHFRYNDVASTDVAVNMSSYHRWTSNYEFDARLNYFGPRGPTNATVAGNVTDDPFLTAPTDEVDVGHATAVGTDVELQAGEAYALGVPGPTGQSIHDILGEEFEGDVYRYGDRAGKWLPVEGQGRHAQVDALDAFKVVPESDARAVISFEQSASREPGPPTGASNRTTLDEGWNFVAAPQYADAETAFGNASANVTEIRPALDGVGTLGNSGSDADDLRTPGSQLGPRGALNGSYEFGSDGSAPTVSAFAGYFVHAESAGSLPATVEANATVGDLFDALGLADAPTGSATTDDARFGATIRNASAADRTAIAAAIVEATPGRSTEAAQERVATALERRPGAVVRTALERASPDERRAILDAIRPALESDSTAKAASLSGTPAQLSLATEAVAP